MTNTNRALWDRVCMTDPKAVKEITGKQYKGNSPKPYWIVERLTEEFGPCGIGWGFTIANERMERLSEDDVLHVAVVDFWYVLGEKSGHIQQVGQTKATYKSSAGKLIVDEDAPKKSVTDALVKCASYIGFAGDIFAGRWDDSKYVAQANAEYRAKEAEAKAAVDENSVEGRLITMLRNASMEGVQALQDKFTGLKEMAEPDILARVWKSHSGSLKIAAAKADADRNAFLSEEGDR